MLGGKNKQSPGYTIVEVMIVLAVSGVMFLIAAVFINGKQEKASFTAGVNEMASEIQDVIEQVTDGQYSDIPLSCTSRGYTLSFTGTAHAQGTNSGCVFRGKDIHFYGASTSGPVNMYEVISLADAFGATDSNGDISSGVTGIPGLTTTSAVPQSLNVESLTTTPLNGSYSSDSEDYNFAILQSSGQLTDQSGDYQSGAQTAILANIVGLGDTLGDTQTEPNNINNNSNNITPISSATLCLTDGTQSADIVIGQDDSDGSTITSQLSVTVQMKGTSSC